MVFINSMEYQSMSCIPNSCSLVTGMNWPDSSNPDGVEKTQAEWWKTRLCLQRPTTSENSRIVMLTNALKITAVLPLGLNNLYSWSLKNTPSRLYKCFFVFLKLFFMKELIHRAHVNRNHFVLCIKTAAVDKNALQWCRNDISLMMYCWHWCPEPAKYNCVSSWLRTLVWQNVNRVAIVPWPRALNKLWLQTWQKQITPCIWEQNQGIGVHTVQVSQSRSQHWPHI